MQRPERERGGRFGSRYTRAEKCGGSDFYPASGYRSYVSGALYDVGSLGCAWSSSPYTATDVNASLLSFTSDFVRTEYYYDRGRSCGFPVRCVQE